MIIVEGPDNSGKTTLINEICEAWPMLKRFKSPGPDASYDWWMKMLTQDTDVLSFSIFDRFLFSEYVYGPICRNTIRLTDHQREVVESLLLTMEPLIISCELIPQQSLFEEREQVFGWDVQLQANELYPKVFADHWRRLHYNVPHGHQFSRDVLPVIEQYLEVMSEWYRRRKVLDHGRGNITNPTWMFVGQQLAHDNKWKVPFERSKSAEVLHHAIRAVGIPFHDIWFTNAYKSDTGLTTRNIGDLRFEIDLLEPPFVVAIGAKAGGLLDLVDQDYVRITHPGYFIRKGFQLGELKENYANTLRSVLDHWL